MTKLLREVMVNQLLRVSGEISHLINKMVIRNQMTYNNETDKFEIQLIRLRRLGITYFEEHPDERAGKIDETNIRWEINSGKLFVWLDL